MNILYFDCFSGISGDMTLGALIDLGIDEHRFRKELEKLQVDGYEIVISKKTKHGISGMDVDVILVQDEEKHHERNLKDIETLIDASGIAERAKDFSKKVFREIAAAEARVHDKSIGEVHFHEVGAVDSIVDIVGTAICLDLLGVERVYSSKLHDGHGFIECRHGIIPVPVPAVMEMLAGSGIPLIQTDIETELVTPTGMGIIKILSSGFGSMPEMFPSKIGYGMGKREYEGFGALRIIMGIVPEPDSNAPEMTIPS